MSKIKTERFYRSAVVELVGRENDDRRIEVAFSSEAPVERSFGQEVLNHDPESIRLGRLKDIGALLVNHYPSDLVGVVEDVNLGSDRVGEQLCGLAILHEHKKFTKMCRTVSAQV